MNAMAGVFWHVQIITHTHKHYSCDVVQQPLTALTTFTAGGGAASFCDFAVSIFSGDGFDRFDSTVFAAFSRPGLTAKSAVRLHTRTLLGDFSPVGA